MEGRVGARADRAVGMVWLGSWDGGAGVGCAGRGELQLRRDPEQTVGRVNPVGSLRAMVPVEVGWCFWEPGAGMVGWEGDGGAAVGGVGDGEGDVRSDGGFVGG